MDTQTQLIITSVLTIILIAVTYWYAYATWQMLKELKAQAKAMQEQGKAMQQQYALMVKSVQVSALSAQMMRWSALVQRPGNIGDPGDNPIDKLRELVQELEELEEK